MASLDVTTPPSSSGSTHPWRQRVWRQSLFVGVLYLAVGGFGLVALPFDFSWMALLLSVLALQVGSTELILGRRFLKSSDSRFLRLLLVHQGWILAAGLTVLHFLYRYDLAELFGQLPPSILQQVEDAAQLTGLHPEAYFILLWKITIVLTAIVFALKHIFLATRYARLLRQAPQEA